MTRTFTVVPSRLAHPRTAYLELTGSTRLEGGDGLVQVVVSDAGAARFVPLLLGLTGVESARLERTLAAAVAATIASERFDFAEPVSSSEFDGETFQTGEGGLGILPYAGADLEASALAALVAPDRFDVDRLEQYLSSVAASDKETRERRNVALAGLGGLRAAVLPRIRAAAADPALTVRERLWLGLGAAALGDAATARSIGASLEAEHGEVTTSTHGSGSGTRRRHHGRDRPDGHARRRQRGPPCTQVLGIRRGRPRHGDDVRAPCRRLRDTDAGARGNRRSDLRLHDR
jgi:hypothetical protein